MNGFTNLKFEIDEDIRFMFTDTLLTILEKESGGLRPIAMTEVFLKLAAKLVSLSLGSGKDVFPSGIII